MFSRPRHELVREVQVDGDRLVGLVHRLATDLGGRRDLVRRPEGTLCDQVRVFLRGVPSEVRVLEHIDADVGPTDALHQLRPRVDAARNENLVEVRDRDVAVTVAHAVDAVVERPALTVHVRLQVSGEWPPDDVDDVVLVRSVAAQCAVCLGRHRVVVDGYLGGAEQFVHLKHLDDHLPVTPPVVQRRDTQRMRVSLLYGLPVKYHQLVAGLRQAPDRADRDGGRHRIYATWQLTDDEV